MPGEEYFPPPRPLPCGTALRSMKTAHDIHRVLAQCEGNLPPPLHCRPPLPPPASTGCLNGNFHARQIARCDKRKEPVFHTGSSHPCSTQQRSCPANETGEKIFCCQLPHQQLSLGSSVLAATITSPIDSTASSRGSRVPRRRLHCRRLHLRRWFPRTVVPCTDPLPSLPRSRSFPMPSDKW